MFGLSSRASGTTKVIPRNPVAAHPRRGWAVDRVATVFLATVVAVTNAVSVTVLLLAALYPHGTPVAVRSGGETESAARPLTTTTSTTEQQDGVALQSADVTERTTATSTVQVTTAPAVATTTTTVPVTAQLTTTTTTTIEVQPTTTVKPESVSPDYYGRGCSGPTDIASCDPTRVCPSAEYPHFTVGPPPRCVP